MIVRFRPEQPDLAPDLVDVRIRGWRKIDAWPTIDKRTPGVVAGVTLTVLIGAVDEWPSRGRMGEPDPQARHVQETSDC
jgi:hypothetical protein